MEENYLKVKKKHINSINKMKRKTIDLNFDRYKLINGYVDELLNEKKCNILKEEEQEDTSKFENVNDERFNELEDIALKTNDENVIEDETYDVEGDIETKEIVTLNIDDLVNKIHSVLLKLKEIDVKLDVKTNDIKDVFNTTISNKQGVLLSDIKNYLDIKIPDTRQKQEMVSLKTPYNINNTNVFDKIGNEHLIQMNKDTKKEIKVPQTDNEIRKSFYNE